MAVMDYDDAMDLIESTLDLISDIEDNYTHQWVEGESFLCDVRGSLQDVKKTLERQGEEIVLTYKQSKAIDNWAAGVRRWHPEYK